MELLKNGGTPAGDSPTEPASPRGAKSIHAEISLVSTRDRLGLNGKRGGLRCLCWSLCCSWLLLSLHRLHNISQLTQRLGPNWTPNWVAINTRSQRATPKPSGSLIKD